jgi:hypothetical protein
MEIPLSLSKYQICVVAGCGCDATQQVASHGNNPRYYLGVCNDPLHQKIANNTLQNLDAGKSPEKMLSVVGAHIFVQPFGHDFKCRWDLYMDKKVVRVCQNWTWEYRPGKWRNAQGKLKAVQDLDDVELLNAVRAIVSANYKRRTPLIAWVNALCTPTKVYQYNLETLAVGLSDAKDKLTEFRQEVIRRGLLTPEKNPLPS